MNLLKAQFLERVNRFVVKVRLGEREVLCYLPNPGRLWELLLPGRTLLLKPSENTRYPYVVLACIKNDFPVLLHTHLTNQYVKILIKEERIPELRGFRIIKEEPGVGKGRLDFLLENKASSEKLYLEVKTCTLFGESLSMFPDAETQRGKRHLYELRELKRRGLNAGCLFVVMSPQVEYFLPAYHIDFDFTRAFLETYEEVLYLAYAVSFSEDLSRVEKIKPLKIPLSFLKEEFQNRGAYLLLLHLEREKRISIGSLGEVLFKDGYYVYVGSARKNLKQRLSRYQQKLFKKRWHIDYLVSCAKLVKPIPIVSSDDLECKLSKDLKSISQGYIPRFGSSDCLCDSHLYYFQENPLKSEDFIELLNFYRLELPALKIKGELENSKAL